jgi:hypothetical protein
MNGLFNDVCAYARPEGKPFIKCSGIWICHCHVNSQRGKRILTYQRFATVVLQNILYGCNASWLFFKRNHNILALTHRKSPAIPHATPLKLFNSFNGRGERPTHSVSRKFLSVYILMIVQGSFSFRSDPQHYKTKRERGKKEWESMQQKININCFYLEHFKIWHVIKHRNKKNLGHNKMWALLCQTETLHNEHPAQ